MLDGTNHAYGLAFLLLAHAHAHGAGVDGAHAGIAQTFDLLERCLRQPRLVPHRDDRLERVWGLDPDTADNVVEVYVGYLRRKIDRPFGRATLQTVRTIGYRLVDDGPT